MEENNFNYSYSAPTEAERREIEAIKREYEKEVKQTSISELRQLDRRVKALPNSLGIGLGVVGTLIFGLGLTMVLEWGLPVPGIILGVIGCVGIALAYPIRMKLYNRNRAIYSKEIIEKANELLK